jgi:hypothetical protein
METYKDFLNGVEFDTKKARDLILLHFGILEEKIKKINGLSEKEGIYINIDERREKEKIIYNLFPYVYLGYNINLSVYKLNNLVEEIKQKFYNRFQNVLNDIGFISINEKNKIIKLNPKYNLIDLHLLNRLIKGLDFNQNDLFIITKEFNNGNKEIKFKEDKYLEVLKEIVFYRNNKTDYILENITEEAKQEYMKAKKIIVEEEEKAKKIKYCFSLPRVSYRRVLPTADHIPSPRLPRWEQQDHDALQRVAFSIKLRRDTELTPFRSARK